MKRTHVAIAVAMAVGTAFGGVSNGLFRVTADRVNLRAKPTPDAEVVGQVSSEAVVRVQRTDGEWAQIAPPTNLGVWVNAAFVRDSVVAADRLLVRAGPGAAFREIGVARRGDRLDSIETRGEWIKCQAPTDVTVWVSASLLAPAEAAVPAPEPAVPQAAQLEPAVGIAAATGTPVGVASGPGSAELPAGLSRESLAAVLGQGGIVERQGTVDRVPAAFLHCSSYRLVVEEAGRVVTVCYLRGNDEQMPSLLGRRFSMRGRAYWLKAEPVPLLFPIEIKPLADQPPVR